MKKDDSFNEERDKIIKGLEETYRRLVEYKKQKKSPLIVLRDGKITEVDPHDVEPTIKIKLNNFSK